MLYVCLAEVEADRVDGVCAHVLSPRVYVYDMHRAHAHMRWLDHVQDVDCFLA
jgi:hypothetical protein